MDIVEVFPYFYIFVSNPLRNHEILLILFLTEVPSNVPSHRRAAKEEHKLSIFPCSSKFHTISIHPSSEDLRSDQMKIGSPCLMLKERDLLGQPIPQYLEGRNPISIAPRVEIFAERIYCCCTAADSTQEGEDDFVYQFPNRHKAQLTAFNTTAASPAPYSPNPKSLRTGSTSYVLNPTRKRAHETTVRKMLKMARRRPILDR
ncbi:hypothetical protein NC653_028433 [Populus alba x Populus x berolinensis]|uniref:Uncharacterized protein n=1 Tax=Populus alba x Populus x berolinensis TaxID=444605 RepID=A0AAD6M7Y9_9ROSI|nr:hypothetical protein NC653_028433 [Populus alba x Populus x berolinensis]